MLTLAKILVRREADVKDDFGRAPSVSAARVLRLEAD